MRRWRRKIINTEESSPRTEIFFTYDDPHEDISERYYLSYNRKRRLLLRHTVLVKACQVSHSVRVIGRLKKKLLGER